MKAVLAILLAVLLGAAWLLPQALEQRDRLADGADVAPTMTFSGYTWEVKTTRGSVSPGPNIFGAKAVQVDAEGHLHLGIVPDGRRWICGEVICARSFGFGEYRYVIRETKDLDVNAVLGLFFWDRKASREFFHEADFELSRWGDESKVNAQFTVQPFSRPGNLVRFEIPRGRAEVLFRWTPGRLFFRALVGGKIVREHMFTKGVPEPAHENVRLNAWLYRSLPPSTGKAVEVVIESFRFLPLDERR